jgi:hypothetical protein
MIFLALLLLPQDRPKPAAVESGWSVELVARDPELATPTGLAVDGRGRIWVVENNTHMRPKGYAGRAADRVLVFDDFGPDGRARSVTPFAEGFSHGMGLGLRAPGEVVLVTRNEIAALRDRDGDGKADDRRTLVRLETTGTYDHNGLFGPAFDASGELFFGLGGNTSGEFPLGAPYTLAGSDGSSISDDEGGRLFKCRADGSRVERVAVGFWNPFHLAFDGQGRLFAVDNDPDERPPCRLLHVVRGGDYGFRRRNGPRGLHPFTAWDGELPGTLPMVCGTGEAPSGIVADGEGSLLVTSWGDHEIQRFRLAPRGASFTSRAESVVRGGESFRPVGIALAPDGSICVSDWVDRSYPVHGKGALWRIRRPKAEAPPAAPALPAEHARLQELLRLEASPADVGRQVPTLADPDPFLASAALGALGRPGNATALARHAADADPAIRVGVLLALRRTGEKADAALRAGLRDPDPRVRKAAIQWVAEERRSEFLPDLPAAAATAPVTLDVFRAYLAAVDFWNAKDRRELDGEVNEAFAARVVEDAAQAPLLRAFALRHVRPTHPALTPARLEELLRSGDEALRIEAVRTLASAPGEEVLRALAADTAAPAALRAEALLGLSGLAARSEATRRLLLSIVRTETGDVRLEAVRALGGAAHDSEVRRVLAELARAEPGDPDLRERLERTLGTVGPERPEGVLTGGDAGAGERVFYHPRGPQCFVCHRVNGRGGTLGPDLTYVSRGLKPEKLLESIVDPGREVAPYFLGWEVVTKDGDTLTGRILKDAPDSVRLLTGAGARVTVKKDDLASRRAMTSSLMPEGLHRVLTRKEFRDLVAFLSGLR